MVQQGVSLLEVGGVLGHASIEMAQRYSHLAPEHLKSAVGALDHLRSSDAGVEKGSRTRVCP
jgi:site-specific recombinase XerD